MHNIRQACPSDSAAIKRLISETLLHCVFDDGDAYSTLFGEICELIDSWMDCPKDIVHLVCERGSAVVGVVFVSRYERLNLLFVHPAHQKAGIGRDLLDSALESCRRVGNSRQVTLNSSSYAAPFYLKYGFAPNGEPEDRPGGCIPLIIKLGGRE